MRRQKRPLGGSQRDAPVIDADDVGQTRSAGEVWIRSGGSGVERGCEEEQREKQQDGAHPRMLNVKW
jgi:hypothetical protein